MFQTIFFRFIFGYNTGIVQTEMFQSIKNKYSSCKHRWWKWRINAYYNYFLYQPTQYLSLAWAFPFVACLMQLYYLSWLRLGTLQKKVRSRRRKRGRIVQKEEQVEPSAENKKLKHISHKKNSGAARREGWNRAGVRSCRPASQSS